MGKGERYAAVLCDLLLADKFHLTRLFIIVIQTCIQSGIFLVYIHGKHRLETKLAIVGQA